MSGGVVPEGFWPQIEHQLARIGHGARSFDAVRAILLDDVYADVRAEVNRNGARRFGESAAFFSGSGGDATLSGALERAGWRWVWAEASYHYVMRNDATGDLLEYVEGDVLRGGDAL